MADLTHSMHGAMATKHMLSMLPAVVIFDVFLTVNLNNCRELAGIVRKLEACNALYEREKERCEAISRRTQRESTHLLQQLQNVEKENARLQMELRRKDHQMELLAERQ